MPMDDNFNLRAELKKLESASFTPKEKLQIIQAIRSHLSNSDTVRFREGMREITFHHTHSKDQERLTPHLIKLFCTIAENFALPFDMRRAAAFNLALLGCEDYVDTNKVISQLRKLGRVAVTGLNEIIFQHTTPETEIVLSANDAITQIRNRDDELNPYDPFGLPDKIIRLGRRRKIRCFRAPRKGERKQVLCTPNPPNRPRLAVRSIKAKN